MLTNKDLVAHGIPGGAYLPSLTAYANSVANEQGRQSGLAAALSYYNEHHKPPYIPLHSAPPSLRVNIEADSEAERANMEASIASMREVAKTPTVRDLALMPDACPSGPMGNITVGGVVATENAIHPGMHSADICCSMMATNLGRVDPAMVMDAAFSNVRFGPLAKNTADRIRVSPSLLAAFMDNPFMRNEKILHCAESQMGTQGDGNHFYFVGVSKRTGDTYLVSHHGSRGLGGQLYKLGMAEAVKHTAKLAPEVMKANSWIAADSQVGQDYWEALQLARLWTKENHSSVHGLIARDLNVDPLDNFWNEHNFVFKRNGLYYHAKGATPAWQGFADDNDPQGRTIIPLNMGQPVLIVRGRDNPDALGFSPHGAGRNFSRTVHKATLNGRSVDEVFHEETAHIDARFQAGRIDTSELPSAYKDAGSVVSQIKRMGLADIVDRIMPYGSIMAGEINAPWKRSGSS